MAPRKRKIDFASASKPANSTKKQKQNNEEIASSSRPSRTSLAAANTPRSTRSSVKSNITTLKNGPVKAQSPEKVAKPSPIKKTVTTTTTKSSNPRKQASRNTVKKDVNATDGSSISVDVPSKKKKVVPGSKAASDRELDEIDDGPSYWLMKAEPESRLEKGKDVKFSIDDLKAATEPEGWDGVRNAVARNNMRLMMKGDRAFFYHSNCKVPGIVGTMEIVQEHSVDESAFDPDHPYYDEKSDRSKPKWCVVHVEFRQKFPEIIKLKELQMYAKDGGVLSNMQTLKQSRLSVSKVTKTEWDFIMGLADTEETAS